ncbi:PREDICTED: uncharacterized protein LOC109215127 [Nicotiana attenuata]|uniref:Uncharacterized protein n=1 Tax=Nicotiana attenuata TaxID=49451 RepID=A0A1J6IQ22_NICAT|nr:PREDICTED: uncharacterized protein LOC109215127 [Nicotiana attenuata]OIT06934.1 hypothetical protein A4A49_31977 [Nicotiana attenuata]
MKSLSSVGLVLSVVFGCLLLALIAELYYLLWWKNRIVKTSLEDGYSSNKAKDFFCMFCIKPSTSLNSNIALKSQEICANGTQLVHEPTIQAQSNVELNSSQWRGQPVEEATDFWFKPFGDDNMENEFIGLCGPPRFLFTIKEETKEDLESEDGKSKGEKSRKGSRTRSLSDLCLNMETPYLTPLTSPPYFTPPLSPMMHKNGFNPFLESISDAEFNKFIRSNSPPPTFKFLRDAEDKFCRRFVEESVPFQVENLEVSSSKLAKDEENGPFITLIFPKNREVQLDQHHVQLDQHHVQLCPSSSSQVLPLV